MFYYLYKITNWYNGKIYVGVHSTENLNDGYMGSGKLIKQAIKKYGLEYFTKDILQFFDNYITMMENEERIVNLDFIKDEMNYNLMKGGGCGWSYVNNGFEMSQSNRIGAFTGHRHSKEAKEKISTKCKEIMKDKEKRKHLSNKLKEYYKINPQSHTGIPLTDEHKQKIGRANSIAQMGEKNQNYGKSWIYNENEKISKLVFREELEYWVSLGWIKGRKQKF